MKITKEQLKRIIKEEIQGLAETDGESGTVSLQDQMRTLKDLYSSSSMAEKGLVAGILKILEPLILNREASTDPIVKKLLGLLAQRANNVAKTPPASPEEG